MIKLLMAVLIILLVGMGYLIGANGKGRYSYMPDQGYCSARYDTRTGETEIKINNTWLKSSDIYNKGSETK